MRAPQLIERWRYFLQSSMRGEPGFKWRYLHNSDTDDNHAQFFPESDDVRTACDIYGDGLPVNGNR